MAGEAVQFFAKSVVVYGLPRRSAPRKDPVFALANDTVVKQSSRMVMEWRMDAAGLGRHAASLLAMTELEVGFPGS